MEATNNIAQIMNPVFLRRLPKHTILPLFNKQVVLPLILKKNYSAFDKPFSKYWPAVPELLTYCSDHLTSQNSFFFLKLCSENINWPLPDSHKRTVSISSNVRLLGNMSFAVMFHLHVNRRESTCRKHCPDAQKH